MKLWRASARTVLAIVFSSPVLIWGQSLPAVSNFSAIQESQIQLSWTVPNNTTAYDIRWSTVGSIATLSAFVGATQLGTNVNGYVINSSTIPAPGGSGTTQTLRVSGLKPRTTFYWAMEYSTGSAFGGLSNSTAAIAGSFYKFPITINPKGGASGLALGDYNNDGFLDAAWGNNRGDIPADVSAISKNNGNGSFTNVFTGLNGDSSADVDWTDYDGDGRLDVAFGNGDNMSLVNGGPAQPVRVYHNDGNNNFSLVWSATSSENSCCVKWGDYNRDGRPDLFVANFNNFPSVQVYRNDITTFTLVWSSTETTAVNYMALGDYNNDGLVDILVGTAQGVWVYKNNGNGTFVKVWSDVPGVDPRVAGVAWGDYDNDGYLDIVANAYQDGPRVYRNNQNGTFTLAATGNVGLRGGVSWGDYDNDGNLDVVTTAFGRAYVMRNNGNGTFSQPSIIETEASGGQTDNALWGDMDGDGGLDVVINNGNTGNGLLLQSVESLFGNSVSTPSAPTSLTASLLTGGTAQFAWNAGSDGSLAASSLYYQVAIATCSSSPCLSLDSTGFNITAPAHFIVSPAYGSPLMGNYLRPKVSNSQLGINLNFNLLTENVTYYFRVATISPELKRGPWSNVGSIYVSEPPASIVNLSTQSVTGSVTQAILAWTAPGDNSNYGTAASYEIRYSNAQITPANFSQATLWKASRAVTGPAGTTETETVTGLTTGAQYYFAVITRDASGNVSGLSNVVSYTPGSDLMPTVLNYSPAANTFGVALSTTVVVQFSKQMSTTSFLTGFSVTGVVDNNGNAINTPVSGTLSYSATTQILIFTSSVPLTSNYTYQVQITTNAIGVNGFAVISSVTWNFTTLFDHSQSNVVNTSQGARFVVPPNSFGIDGYITVSTAVQNSMVQTANQKITTEDNFSSPVSVLSFQALDSSGNLIQPASPLSVTISYPNANHDGIVDGTNPPVRAKTLALWWLDPNSQSWMRIPGIQVDTLSNTVTSPIPHFSTFGLIGAQDTSLSDAHAFPVPYVPAKQTTRVITFSGLSSIATIRVYTVDGILIRSMDVNSGAGTATWDVKDGSGHDVASGVYLYSITNSQETATGKLMVIR